MYILPRMSSRALIAASLLIVLVVTSCANSEKEHPGSGGTTEGRNSHGGKVAWDVSRSGQKKYACALANHIVDEHGYADTDDDDNWGKTLGKHASPGIIETAGLAGLLGGFNGHGGAPTKLERGIDKLVIEQDDTESLNRALKKIVSTCKQPKRLTKDQVSRAGQKDYACALVKHTVDVHGYADADADPKTKDAKHWGKGIGRDASPGWIEVGAIAGLLGGATGHGGPPKKLYTGVDRQDPQEVDAGLKATAAKCG